jgi:DNA-binding beta-propeller fold protein YncE
MLPPEYRVVPEWPRLPAGWSFGEVVGIAVDARDRAFVFCRGEHPLMIFEADGTFVGAWGEGEFVRPHGITIAPGGEVWCTDDMGHTVSKFTPEGKRLLTLGVRGRPAETGIDGMDYRTIARSAGPFNMPTNLAIAPSGELFISDGYGNARVHRYSADGQLLSSWGAPGDAPGHFNVPHGIAIDRRGKVYVADRENSRIQIFSADGKLLDQWTNVSRPMQIFFDAEERAFVCELGFRAGRFPFQAAPPPPVRGACVSIFDLQGKVLARWGGGDDPCAPGDFFAPHGICVDSTGSIYVGEVVLSAGANRGLVSPTCHALQKFARVR